MSAIHSSTAQFQNERPGKTEGVPDEGRTPSARET